MLVFLNDSGVAVELDVLVELVHDELLVRGEHIDHGQRGQRPGGHLLQRQLQVGRVLRYLSPSPLCARYLRLHVLLHDLVHVLGEHLVGEVLVVHEPDGRAHVPVELLVGDELRHRVGERLRV